MDGTFREAARCLLRSATPGQPLASGQRVRLRRFQIIAEYERRGPQKDALDLALQEAGRQNENLNREKAALEAELGKWRGIAEERQLILSHLLYRFWVRLGLRCGVVRRPGIAGASQDMTYRPSRWTKGYSADSQGGYESRPDKLGRWRLRSADGSMVSLVFAPEDNDPVRIAITKAGARTPWDIQLSLPGLQIKSNCRYSVQFRARAERRRRIAVGFAQAHEPWAGLGLYDNIGLTTSWQIFEKEFTAIADEENGRIHFDVGGKNIRVEVAAVALHLVRDESEVPRPLGRLEPPDCSSEGSA